MSRYLFVTNGLDGEPIAFYSNLEKALENDPIVFLYKENEDGQYQLLDKIRLGN